jgi:hypothetical protein
MSRFKTPQRKRFAKAQRYASDPQFRLNAVNRNRARAGLPPYASAEEIPSYSELAKAAARDRARNEQGRFV